MRVDTTKIYRIPVNQLMELLGIPANETVRTVHDGIVTPTGVIEIITSTKSQEIDLFAP